MPEQLFPTVIHRGHHPQADDLNPSLRALIDKDHSTPQGPTFASSDDFLSRYQATAEIQALFSFLSDLVFQAAHAANQVIWSELGSPQVRIVVVGAWYQIQNQGGRHGVHNHGNCSWSGVYYVDIDDPEQRRAHPTWGQENGVTRFHSPHLPRLGGAHMDLGNAYLQHSTYDVDPVPGHAVVFPSWILHEALPYHGVRDRVIISFNAQLHAKGQTSGLPFGF